MLSVFGGIECGAVALNQTGFKYNNYFRINTFQSYYSNPFSLLNKENINLNETTTPSINAHPIIHLLYIGEIGKCNVNYIM